MTLQLDPVRGVLVVWGYECVNDWNEREENLPQVLFYVLKSCENLPNVHIDLFSNLGLWCVPFPCFYFKLLHTFSFAAHTWFPCICSFKAVVTWSHATVGNFLMYLASWSAVQDNVFEICWHRTCVFDLWPCYFTESEKKLIQKGTLVYFVKLKKK